MNTLEYLAFYTFLIQGFLFPIMIVALTVYIVKGMMTRARFKQEKKSGKKSKQKKDDGMPVLKPLQCSNCAGPILLKEDYTKCRFCESPVSIPKDYFLVANMRKDIAIRLRKAETYFHKVKIFTSPAIKWLLRALYIWLILTIIILLKNDGEPLQEELFEKVKNAVWGLGEWLEALSLLTIACWIILIMTTIWGISTKSRKFLPVMEMPDELKKNENTNCTTCGGGIEFNKGELAALCSYCGVENYRAKFAVKVKSVTSEIRESSNFSLIEAMDAYDEAVDDILSTPAILVFILIILPFFFILLPKLLFEYLSENLLPLLIFIALVIGFILFLVFRKKKTPESKSPVTK